MGSSSCRTGALGAWGGLSIEPVVAKLEDYQVAQRVERGIRNPVELVVSQIQLLQAPEAQEQPGRDAGEVVAAQVQRLQAPE
eukprot:CAMPEP_0183802408 /NCGR_PEP_ID=MMETSP0803_2-20130417/30288_1 /TAXON_ID=195967 /ORGANISM="Crustomastix stigmata, Strain CCMP3273" /LENGTH=81 /DNA_ID=CAMNT_0026047139 /DNA_START=169 /DNA_END=412 /DNA_ORIENTATION=+